jgi:hypothetical protein
MTYSNYIKLYGNIGIRKVIKKIKLKLFHTKFEKIYNNFIKLLDNYIAESKYDLLITKLSYSCMKRLLKNIILEYIRNNENLLYQYITTKYPKINFHCIDTYNFYFNKKKKQRYIFCYEDNKIVTYKLTKNNYSKTNIKIMFDYKISNDTHPQVCIKTKPHNILSFVDYPIYGSSSKYTTLYKTCINTTYNQLLELTKDNETHNIFLSQYNIQEIGHANSIIINNNEKKIIRLEPLVKEPINNIGSVINKLVKETNYKYISVTNDLNIIKGLQKTSQTGDWCTIWAYYMALLYYENETKYKKLFKFLLELEEYNTNFMFYYIFDTFYNEKVINQELINNLLDKTLKYFDSLKHIQNEKFIRVITYLTDYSMLPQIIRIFDEKEDEKSLKTFIKNIHENFDKDSKLFIKNIFIEFLKN